MAEEFVDNNTLADGTITTDVDSKYKDLLMSELFELKNLWFLFSKKINSMLSILP